MEKVLAKLKAAKALTDQFIQLVSEHSDSLERLAKRLVRMQTIVYVALLMLRNAKRDSARLGVAKTFVRMFLPEVQFNADMITAYFEEL
jgi:hypothetical protein